MTNTNQQEQLYSLAELLEHFKTIEFPAWGHEIVMLWCNDGKWHAGLRNYKLDSKSTFEGETAFKAADNLYKFCLTNGHINPIEPYTPPVGDGNLFKLKKWVDDHYPNFNKADIESKIDELIGEDGKLGGEDTDVIEDILSGYESVNVMTDYDHYEEHYHKDCVIQAMKEYKSHPSTPVQDGWVRVEDGELPEHETVLVKIGDDTILLGICNSKKEWAIYYSDGRNSESIERPVTHWMKLPTPPKP